MYANTIGLTYTRYTRPNQISLQDLEKQKAQGSKPAAESQDAANRAKEAEELKKPRGDPAKRKRGRSPVPQMALPQELKNQLNDLTDRLNIRVSSMRRSVEFKIDQTGQIPQIQMIDKLNQDELNRYDMSQMLDLERSLYDMAGFRFSFHA
jgi:uncharacterized FlaG/YvyC family protein